MRFVKLALLAGVPFGAALGIVNGINHGLGSGLGSGIVCGILFGVGIALFLQRQTKRFADLRPKYEAEGLVLDAPANLGGAGGWLFLTKQRLVFEPHGVNIKAKRVEIPREDLREVRPGGGKLVRRFEVVTPTATLTFLVEDRNAWIAALKESSSARSA